MKKILIILCLFYNFAFSNSLGLSETDIIILKKIKSLTDDRMMKYTLMALAIKESSVGKNQINLISNDFGLFQSNIKSVIRRQKVQDNLFNRKYLNSIQYYLFILKTISRNLLKIIFYSFKNLKSSKSIFTGTIDGILNKKGKKES